ncbi:MAG: SDR family oxidoreductase [Bryobacteraceae bacterium]
MAFTDVTVGVLGATGSVGSALARRLHKAGATVILCGRNAEKLNALGAELGARTVQADAAKPGELDQAIGAMGPLYGIASCIGSLVLKPAHATSDADWDSAIALNLTSAFQTVRAGTKTMLNGGGSIVLVSSSAARIGLANHEAIAAAKAGVAGLTLSAAATYAPRGIRVNCVSPGLVMSGLTQRITSNEASLKASVAMHALGRVGSPEDVASAIAWLLDPEQRWVTGQVLGVDGGLGSVRSR